MNAKPLRTLRQMAPLLVAARDCEAMSRDVSRRQGELAPAPLAAALRVQSHQESLHATVFEVALSFAPSNAGCPPRLTRLLADYAYRLHADLDAGALVPSLIGLQCVFEGLATVALEPAEGELANMGERFVPLRALVRRQEVAHHRLGTIWVPRLAATVEPHLVARAWFGYAALAEDIVETALATFDGAAADQAHYAERSRSHLRALQLTINETQWPASAPKHAPERSES